MSQATDRKKRRREYVRKKALITGFLGLVFTLAAAWTVHLIWTVVRAIITFPGWPVEMPWLPVVAIAVTVLWIAGAFYIWSTLIRLRKEISLPDYVPPVTKADTLPVQEVLVRSTTEPLTTQNETLLRAAKSNETPKEQLLHVTEN